MNWSTVGERLPPPPIRVVEVERRRERRARRSKRRARRRITRSKRAAHAYHRSHVGCTRAFVELGLQSHVEVSANTALGEAAARAARAQLDRRNAQPAQPSHLDTWMRARAARRPTAPSTALGLHPRTFALHAVERALRARSPSLRSTIRLDARVAGAQVALNSVARKKSRRVDLRSATTMVFAVGAPHLSAARLSTTAGSSSESADTACLPHTRAIVARGRRITPFDLTSASAMAISNRWRGRTLPRGSASARRRAASSSTARRSASSKPGRRTWRCSMAEALATRLRVQRATARRGRRGRARSSRRRNSFGARRGGRRAAPPRRLRGLSRTIPTIVQRRAVSAHPRR